MAATVDAVDAKGAFGKSTLWENNEFSNKVEGLGFLVWMSELCTTSLIGARISRQFNVPADQLRSAAQIKDDFQGVELIGDCLKLKP